MRLISIHDHYELPQLSRALHSSAELSQPSHSSQGRPAALSCFAVPLCSLSGRRAAEPAPYSASCMSLVAPRPAPARSERHRDHLRTEIRAELLVPRPRPAVNTAATGRANSGKTRRHIGRVSGPPALSPQTQPVRLASNAVSVLHCVSYCPPRASVKHSKRTRNDLYR